jgi:hypothetical protein
VLGVAFMASAGLALAAPAQPDLPPARKVAVAAGATQALSGKLKGYQLADYLIPLEAGQSVVMQLRTSNPSGYFNVDAPGATDGAMFVGSTSGNRFETVAPVSGDYLVRVYLMRSAARRNELARYTLSVRAGAHPGKAAASDARVAGTPFHATASIRCMLAGGQPTTCEAGVMRREAGAGTVRITLPGGAVRHVAFAGGKAVSSDGPASLEVERAGDTSVITLGNGDRFEIPDALVTGG